MSRALFALSVLGLVLAGLSACSENGFNTVEDVGRFGPEIALDPDHVDFGDVKVGEQAVATVTVTNVGEVDATIDHLTVDGEPFAVLTDVDAGFVLPPGAAQSFDVAFTPTGAEDEVGFVDVFSDDADDKALEVTLTGAGAAPQLTIDPDPYDFGLDYVGCGSGQDFALTNTGTDTLEIDDVSYVGDGQLALSGVPALPLWLDPGQQTSVHVDFLPTDEGAVTGELHVLSNDPRGEQIGVQTAEGEYAGKLKDEFAIPDNPPVDILFAVDQSCSMDDDVSRLANQFSTFISTINTYTSDWHIGVATADDGCFNNGVLTSATAGYTSKFESAVDGAGGTWTEALLTVSDNALKKTGSTGCNSGFLRPDAMLHVILVSDEPEQSASSWSTYVSDMQTYKSDPKLLKISAIAGDYPSGCSTAEYGSGYYEAATATGGEFLSICGDWSSHAKDLATASVEGLYDFELSSTPDPKTIRVWVNGNEWTKDWHYDGASNEVQFDTNLDSGKVVVTYGMLVPCD